MIAFWILYWMLDTKVDRPAIAAEEDLHLISPQRLSPAGPASPESLTPFLHRSQLAVLSLSPPVTPRRRPPYGTALFRHFRLKAQRPLQAPGCLLIHHFIFDHEQRLPSTAVDCDFCGGCFGTHCQPPVAEFVGLDIIAQGNGPAKAKFQAFAKLRQPKTFADLNMLIGCFGFYQEATPPSL